MRWSRKAQPISRITDAYALQYDVAANGNSDQELSKEGPREGHHDFKRGDSYNDSDWAHFVRDGPCFGCDAMRESLARYAVSTLLQPPFSLFACDLLVLVWRASLEWRTCERSSLFASTANPFSPTYSWNTKCKK